MYIYNRRYLGTKTKLLPFIETIINEKCGKISSFLDLFGGTGTVANHFNSKDTKIIVNDLLESNYVNYVTWLSNLPYDESKVKSLLLEYNSIQFKKNKENYFSKNFSNTFFSAENAFMIGEIRDDIEKHLDLTVREKSILISSLMYAADKASNTFGHYESYRKKLDTTKKINLIMPTIDNNNALNEIYKIDANELVKKISADVVYIDPPYNSRQYSDAYHLMENLVTWKKPEVFGVAKKMNERSHLKSEYCKVNASKFFEELIHNISAKYIVVSYNNMGEKGAGRSQAKLSDKDIVSSLEKRGTVEVFEQNFKFFNAGKTKVIEEFKERVFLCKI